MNKPSVNRIFVIIAVVLFVAVIVTSGIILGLYLSHEKDAVSTSTAESEDIANNSAYNDVKVIVDSSEAQLPESTEHSVTEEPEKDEKGYLKVYRHYFDDVFAGRTGIYHPEAAKYGDNGEKQKIFMTLMDITDDGVPELLVESPSFDVAWQAYTVEGDGYKCINFGDQQIDFYDPDKKKLYTSCPYSYTYSFDVYNADSGNLTGEYRIEVGCEDYEWGEDQSMRFEFANGSFNLTGTLLSDEEAKKLWDEYHSGLEKYSITGTEITPENLDQYFGID